MTPITQPQALNDTDSRLLLAHKLRERLAGLTRQFGLSHGQCALWMTHQLSPDPGILNVPFAARLRRAMNLRRLEGALRAALARHPSLRTRYYVEDGAPLQAVLTPDSVTTTVEVVEAASWSEAELQRRLTSDAYAPFDLSSGSLLRCILYSRTHENDVLLITGHHIALDFWSLGILVRELIASCAGVEPVSEMSAPSPGPPYSEFVRWQAEMLSGPTGEEHWKYWQFVLDGAPLRSGFPVSGTDYVRTQSSASFPFFIEADVIARLKEVAREEGASLYCVLLAAFQVLLYRYSHQEDICIGSFAHGRADSRFQNTVGYFVNPLVMRAHVRPAQTFRQFVQVGKEGVHGALAHQDFPFPLLVERLQPDRHDGAWPWFQAVFVFEQSHLSEQRGIARFAMGSPDACIAAGALVLEGFRIEEKRTQFPLTWLAEEVDGILYCSFEYQHRFFSRSAVERLAGNLTALLTAIAAGPDQRIDRIPCITLAERQRLLDWSGSEPQPGAEAAVDCLERHAREVPHGPALVCDEQVFSWKTLNAAANQLARHLQASGTRPGDIVGVYLERSAAAVVSFLAIQKASATYLPLDPSYPHSRLEYMVACTDVRLVITTLACREAARLGCAMVALDKEAAAIAERGEDDFDFQDVGQPAYIIFTSGSTGLPKGVAIEQLGLANLIASQRDLFGFTPHDRVLHAASLNFDASIFETGLMLGSGAALHVATADRALPGPTLEQFIRENSITAVVLTPAVLALLRPEDARPITTVIAAGEDCPAELVTRWHPYARVFNAYGPTEVTVWASAGLCNDDGRHPGIGEAVRNAWVFVLDGNLEPVPIGAAGELYVAGAGLARGYTGQPALTAERFIPNPFGPAGSRLYNTGDVARFREDGELEFLGRMDRQLKIRGHRIEPTEVESALLQHTAVRAAVVLPHANDRGRLQLCAFATAQTQGVTPSSASLRQFLLERLPRWAVPDVIRVVPNLPFTPGGKIDSAALLTMITQDEYPQPPASVPPRTDTERSIAAVWAEVLGIAGNSFGVYDSFYDLGGDSLLGMQAVAKIRSQLDCDLSVSSFFEEPTIAAISVRLSPATGNQNIPTVCRAGGVQTTSFGQRRLYFLQQLDPSSSAYHIAGGVRLSGDVRADALERSINELVQRHEALRTRFIAINGEPHQVIDEQVRIPLPVEDLSGLDEEARRQQLERRAGEEARAPFDLTRGPLLRVRWLRLAERESALLVTMHHIVSDGWSLGVFVRELSELYQAACDGRAAALPELPIQYADYAVWQRERLQGKRLDTLLHYWKKQLEGVPVLELPGSRPRPAVRRYRGARHVFAIPEHLTQQLERFSRTHNATLFMTLLAGFQLLLHRYTGQTDIAVGTPIANRTHAQTEGLIGFFVNTLVLRTDLSGDPDFQQLVGRVRRVALDAYTHQELPFERLVDELHPERSLSTSPLFQVMFNMLNGPDPRPDLFERQNRTDCAGSGRFQIRSYSVRGAARRQHHIRVLLRSRPVRPGLDRGVRYRVLRCAGSGHEFTSRGAHIVIAGNG